VAIPERGWFVIANGNAGSAERTAVDAAVGLLAEAAPVRLRPTADPDELRRALDDAATDGLDVVVAGGDGSLHAVVAALTAAGRLTPDRPLGLVPLGTGNDFARGVDLPLDPAEAAARLVGGRPRPMDLLVADTGAVVVNAVHAGLGAAAAERADGMKERLGALAYPVGALLAAVRGEGWALAVEVDGTPLDLPGDTVLMAGVGNGPSIGGGTLLLPDARPDDGLLDVMVSCATGPAARAAFGTALRNGTHTERDDVVTARGRTVRISGDPVGYDADGELEDEVADRTYTVDPGAWALVL
jgi:YegS/Rv2252/BmrU family lipid kinase